MAKSERVKKSTLKSPTPHEQYIRLRNRAIRSLRDGGWEELEIAEVFRIHKASVSRIIRRKQTNVREGLRQRKLAKRTLA